MRKPPRFDDWLDYCFTFAYGDFHEIVGSSPNRYTELGRLGPATAAEYLTRLFESPASIAERYTPDQIGDAVWFIFGVGSCYFGTATSAEVPTDLQVRLIRSVATMYTDLFDRVCGRMGEAPDEDLSDTDKVDIAVYMIWDMDQIEYVHRKSTALVEPTLDVLSAILLRCRNSTCQRSALHGLGHLIFSSGYRKSPIKTDRLTAIIDEYLRARRPTQWLRLYATEARAGTVM